MKKILIAGAMLLSSGAMAADVLICSYSKADISKGMNAPMIRLGNGKVEFNGSSFKATRPDGSYVFTSPLTTKKDGLIMLDDKTKVFAASIDKSSFAVSDRIAKTTEQWANCTPEIKAENKIKRIENPKWRELNPNEKNAIEESIKNQLKDPFSAQFKHSRYISNGNGEYCGLVNSKNSYGGYVGYTPFLVMLVGKGKDLHSAVIAFGSQETDQLVTTQICKDIGYF